MTIRDLLLTALFATALATVPACKAEVHEGHDHADHADGDHAGHDHDEHGHEHGDGHAHDSDTGHASHAHEGETPLGTANIGGLTVTLAQGHGALVAGEESHLVVKLPYDDRGSTVVRAWIGSEDRTLSFVGKGEYAPSHDDYDIHATAPDPLPADAMWWIEIQKPDGTKLVGSARPLRE